VVDQPLGNVVGPIHLMVVSLRLWRVVVIILLRETVHVERRPNQSLLPGHQRGLCDFPRIPRGIEGWPHRE
jgi:hypothetical protein